VLLEDLRSANGTRVNGVRITEPVPLGEGDLVRIGDYGVALRPDGVPLDVPLPRATAPEPPSVPTGDVLADTAPHPLVAGAVEQAGAPVPELEAPVRRSRWALGVVGLGLVLGLGGALLLRVRDGDGSRSGTRFRPAHAGSGGRGSPPSPTEPPPLELTPPTVPATRPSTATEWMAAARRRRGP
jgi:hypothetical protein